MAEQALEESHEAEIERLKDVNDMLKSIKSKSSKQPAETPPITSQ